MMCSSRIKRNNVWILFWNLVICCIQGRETITVRLHIVDPKFRVMMLEEDVFRVTESPSNIPSKVHSISPTLIPSLSPTNSIVPTIMPSDNPTQTLSDHPSQTPSIVPSQSPTAFLSEAPSYNPSSVPSITPTKSSNPTHFVNKDKKGFFTYNPNSEDYGPDEWKHVYETVEDETWARFPDEVWGFERDNQCGKNNRQSPIDVCDGIGDGTDNSTSQLLNNVNSPCYEFHRSYTEGKDWTLNDESKIKAQILPSKLRLWYEKRHCKFQEGFGVKGGGSPVWFPLPKDKGGKYDWCDYEPPAIDFPNHWNGHIQPIHIDVKFPSEHTICGKRYEGEFMVWHAHPQRQAVITMSTLIEVGAHNFEMQKAIDAWQTKFDIAKWSCAKRRNRVLREEERFKNRMHNFLKTGIDHEHVSAHDNNYMELLFESSSETYNANSSSTLQDLLDHSDRHLNKEGKKLHQRRTQEDVIFNPYGDEIYRSKWFYGYWGSLTEPPCTGRFVTHRIMDAPMEISEIQLQQMKHILFKHVDENCDKTSVDWNGSVARPQQPFNNRALWRCNRERWEYDFESWRCDGHQGTQYGCVREGQSMIHGEPE